ncbi:hypothetical protein TNCV_1031961 [Trichonephila clavipes]|nr:hypothetical protein TNCV_1031961 [Trichonephila clavipes]
MNKSVREGDAPPFLKLRSTCVESLSVPSFLYVSDSLWYPWKGKKEYVPLRTAYGQDSRCGMQPKAKHSLRAQAQLSETKTETRRL